MSTYRLDRLFAPRSVALVGASPRPTSVGRTILSNLRTGGFAGAIYLVNPRYGEIEGIAAVKSIADLPEIREVDLNPLLADESGVIAIDARVAIAPVDRFRPAPSGHPRFAIRPYPKEWERQAALKDGTVVFLRPIRPEDERLYPPFLTRVSQQDLRLRFFAPAKQFNHALIARFTQLDYARAMAFIAIGAASGEMLGVARLHANSNYDTAEYAVLVRSDLKGKGLGWLLMQAIIDYARSEGLATIEGQVLNENTTMLQMCVELGFAIAPDPNELGVSAVRLALKKKRPDREYS